MYIKSDEIEKCFLGLPGNNDIYLEYQKLMKAQYDKEQIENLQKSRLKKVIEEAYSRNAFYQKRFEKAELNGNCNSIEELESYPILTKSDIKENFIELITKDYPLKQCMRNRTSGSTGQPVVNLQDYRIHNMIFSVNFLRERSAWGCGGMSRILMVVPKHYAIMGVEFPDYVINEITFDKVWQIHPSEEKYDYHNTFSKVRPEIIYGNPYLLLYMAHQIEEDKANIVKPKIIISSFEMLGKTERNYLSRIFECPICDVYGLSEIGDVAWQCEKQDGYHINEENVIVEVVDENGKQVIEQDGDILVTSLYNYPMPIIRYKTGDRGSLTRTFCACGRKLLRLKKIYGRNVDFIILPSGKRISPYDLMNVMNIINIKQFQIVQESTQNIVVRYVSDLNEQVISGLKEKMRQIVEESMEVKFECVDSIPLYGGKMKTIISLLPAEMEK